jgi:hypothetical protein
MARTISVCRAIEGKNTVQVVKVESNRIFVKTDVTNEDDVRSLIEKIS